MADQYELVFVYKFYDCFRLDKVLIAKNKILENGPDKGRKLDDLYNEVKNNIIPFNSKRKGIYLKKTISKEDLENENIEIDDYLVRYNITNIDIFTHDLEIMPTKEMLTKTEKEDATIALLNPIYKMVRSKKIVSFKEMRKTVLKHENERLNELKYETESVLESIRKNGNNHEYEQKLEKIKEEIDTKTKEINKLIRQQSNNIKGA